MAVSVNMTVIRASQIKSIQFSGARVPLQSTPHHQMLVPIQWHSDKVKNT